MVEGAAAIVPFGGLAIGMVFGVTVQRSHFCSMGCISDAVLFGSFRRLRIWALAIAVALLGSQALHAAGLVDLGGTGYRQPGVFWLGALLGRPAVRVRHGAGRRVCQPQSRPVRRRAA